MKLALFDLDNTLIANDSDYLWGEFLTENGYVDGNSYKEGHDRFYEDYLNGVLDIDEFLKFQLHPLSTQPISVLEEWRERYLEEKIQPYMLPAAKELIEKHRQQNHILMIITATNRFITQPIANMLNVEHLIACEPEVKDGRYTGDYVDVPSFQEGKVTRLNNWLKQQEQELTESWFYSDSRNDIPLLDIVDHATAVDPDETLKNYAIEKDWPVISLRK